MTLVNHSIVAGSGTIMLSNVLPFYTNLQIIMIWSDFSLRSGSVGHKSERSIGSRSKHSKKSSNYDSKSEPDSEEKELLGSASIKISLDSDSEVIQPLLLNQ